MSLTCILVRVMYILMFVKGAHESQPQVIKVYQLLAQGLWFTPGTSTTKTGRHDIAEILLKVALSTINQIKSNQILVNGNFIF